MRILHVLPKLPYFGRGVVVGGYASAVVALAKRQTWDGHEVGIVAGRAHGGAAWDQSEFDVAWTSDRAGVLGRITSLAAEMHRVVRAEQPDVVHAHSGYVDYAPVFQLFARPAQRTFWTLYCPWQSRVGMGLNQIAARTATHFDCVSAMSQNVARTIAQATAVNDPRVTYAAVDTTRFHHVPRNRQGGGHQLLFVGNLLRSKNLVGTLEAFSLLDPVERGLTLRVTTELEASSPGSARRDVEAALDRSQLRPSVVFSGIIPDMPQLIARSDVIVLPFLDTNGPSDFFVAALEALSIGRPVVASRIGGMAELEGTEGLFLCEPTSPDDIAQAVLEATKFEPTGSMLPTCFEPASVSMMVQEMYESQG